MSLTDDGLLFPAVSILPATAHCFAMLSRALLLAALASLCASHALAAGLDTDPFTLPDGRVIIPGENDAEVRSGDVASGDIYTTLTHDGPMAGVGQPQRNDPRGPGGRALRVKNQQPQGIRSPHDGGDII